MSHNPTGMLSLVSGIALMVVSLLVFLIYGNTAIGTAILVIGLVLVVNGGKTRPPNSRLTSRNKVLIVGTLVILVIILIALIGVPFWIARGTFGRTFLDRPGFSIVAINLSKNGTDCYIRSTVWNKGNVFIERLTLSLNGTYVWSDGWVTLENSDADPSDLDHELYVLFWERDCS